MIAGVTGSGGGATTTVAAAATTTTTTATRPNYHDADLNSGIMDERVLALVFQSINWDPHAVSRAACLCRKITAVARRVLWRDLCYARAPRIVFTLVAPSSLPSSPTSSTSVAGGWPALAKLFFHCCGCTSTHHLLQLPYTSPGHLTTTSRFSKTSGRSFLSKRCINDLLYVSDPCEHQDPSLSSSCDVGVYRAVFREFIYSRTRAVLLYKRAQLDADVRCPYCGARAWSMAAAKMVPKSAARRLGSSQGCLDYFVCVHGHLPAHAPLLVG